MKKTHSICSAESSGNYNTPFTLSSGTMIVGATILETKPVKMTYKDFNF